MTWVRQGCIFTRHRSHAQCPTVLVRHDTLRVFYADRDEAGKSYIAYFDVARDRPSLVVGIHRDEIIERGE